MNDANNNKTLQSKHYMRECDIYIMMYQKIIQYIQENALVCNVCKVLYYNIYIYIFIRTESTHFNIHIIQ